MSQYLFPLYDTSKKGKSEFGIFKSTEMGEDGQLSIDFLIGFTLFIIGFIFVVTLMSGLLVGLQSKTIDYDAVAYRTSVILVEDPGEPSNWFIYKDYEKDNIIRLGLALSREYPGVLSEVKVERFFDSAFFSYPGDYRDRLIFSGKGFFPYEFQITLRNSQGNYLYPPKHGYIKRAVFIKKNPDVVEFNCWGNPQEIDIDLNFPELYDSERGEIYQIDPRQMPIRMRLRTDPGVELSDIIIGLLDSNGIFTPLPGFSSLPVETSGGNAPPYPITIQDDGSGSGYIDISFPAGCFYDFTNKESHVLIKATFNSPNQVMQEYQYDYNTAYGAEELQPAILEVRVW